MSSCLKRWLVALLPMAVVIGHAATPCPNGRTYPVHAHITATVFWIGETASARNHVITNIAGVWDDHWQDHYGGVDDPAHRRGFYPAGFLPRENPFYCALPYTDFCATGRKASALTVIPWAGDRAWGRRDSLCKNRWLLIAYHDKIAYAQWEDAGPFTTDDAAYVFGTSPPVNAENDGAGIDISPAVRDYLGMTDNAQVDWRFVETKDVPDGPWKKIVTTSLISWE